jgi:recombination protein RecA
MDIRRIAAIKDGENVIGNRTRVKVVKNKMAPPFKEVEFDIIYGEGISKEGDLLDLASNMNIIEKSGTWYTYKDERIGQGRENARNWLKENSKAVETIRAEVLKKAGIGVKPMAPAAASAGANGASAASANAQAPAGATMAGKPTMAAAPAKGAPAKK